MLTAVEIFEEYAKCLDNPIYAIETYLQTFDKTQEGFVPFKLFVRQKEIVRAYEKHNFNLVTKPRQAGISTTTQGYCAIKIGFADPNNPETIIVIANKLTLAKKFLKGIKDYVNQLPRWVWGNEYYGDKDKEKKSIFVKDSQIEVELPNGSKIIAVATSEDALRGYTPTFLIFDEAAFIDRGADLYAAAVTSLSTGGKAILISCVTKDSFVFTDDGIKQISSLIDENNIGGYNVPHYNIRGLDKYRHSNIMFNNGLQDTIKIKTQSSELEGTHTHKVWAYSYSKKCYDWFAMSELEIGDSINIQHGFELWGNNDNITLNYNFSNKEHKPKIIYDKIDTNLAYLIGLYISEGSCYKPKNKDGVIIGCDVTITCGDYIGDWITNAGFTYSAHDNLHYKISNKYFGALLESLGFDLSLKAKEKYIPERLLSMSRENIIAMLQGIMDGDGYSDAKRGRVGIRLASEKMIKQIRALFLNFGILTEYNYGINKPSELVKVHSNYYNISATSSNAKKYYDLIGFRFNRKQIKQTALDKIKKKNSYYFIPDGKNIIRNILDENKLVRKLSNTGLKVNTIKLDSTNKTHDLNIKKFNEFIDYFINVLNLDLSKYELDKILLNNGRWEHIKSIDYSQNETYDFSLPNNDNDFWCHSIIYNGILGHQTPNGYDPLYYKTYEQAKRGENTYNIIELKWYEDPRYNKDLSWTKNEETVNEYEFKLDSYAKRIKDGWKPASSWYTNMCKNMNNDKKKIAQELDVSFLGSGGNVIDDEYIDFHEKNNVTEPKYVDKTYYDGNSGLVWIWSEPIEDHEYIMAADIARGDGADYSCFQIIDFTTMEQVVEFQGKIPPDSFAEVLEIYGLKYDAFLIVDNIGVGNTTTSKLVELKYPNLYYDEKTKDNKVAGFNINGCRLQLISNLEIAIRTNTIKINSIRLIHEMKTYIYKNGRPDHMEGYNDDCLKKGTLIKTIEGYKPIEDIKVGDLVLTHLGRYKEVQACLEKPFNGEWYDFKFQGMLNLGLSYNHPLYSAPNTWKDVNSDDYNKREWVLPNEWDKNKNGSIRKQTNRSKRQVSIKENLPENNNTVLNYNDFRTKHPNELNAGLNKITLDNNFAKFLGLFLADGYAPTIEKEYDGNKYYTMSIAFHVKDEFLCVEMSEYLKSININSHRSKVKGNGFALIFSSKFLSGILSHCYNNNREKILPYYAYNLGQDLNLVLDYWIKGDGWIDNKHVYDFIAASTSKQLALSMMDIAWSCGKYATISLHTRHRYDVKTKDQYWVNIRNEFKDGDRLKLLSDFEYGNKTVKINKTIYNGTVYNLQVKDDESFIADGIVVHNCLMSLGMALWVLESSFKSLKKAKAQTKAILAGWTVGGSDGSTSTITTIDPISNKKVTKINPNHSAYRNVQDPNGDYMWLFSGMR